MLADDRRSWAWSAPPPASAQLGSLIVSVTEPAPGSTVGGTIRSAPASTVVGLLTVRGVQFTLDGVNLGAEDAAPPYSVPWNTTAVSNGSHTLRAVARDLLGAAGHPIRSRSRCSTTRRRRPSGSCRPRLAPCSRAPSRVSANASDNVGVVGVQFRLDGAALGAEDTSAPYSIAVGHAHGEQRLAHADRRRARRGRKQRPPRHRSPSSVDNARPTVTITAPVGRDLRLGHHHGDGERLGQHRRRRACGSSPTACRLAPRTRRRPIPSPGTRRPQPMEHGR